MELTSSGSSKRARGPSSGSHVASCLVDGCNSDLSKCRDYHRRHKVCELHSKSPTVTIRGREQRFCQQCSRFHSLVEFDEGKRSCRKRLDGHNRRRRKPQPESSSLNSERFLTHHQGAFLQFSSSPQTYPTSALISSAWTGVVNAEKDVRIMNSHLQINFSDSKSSFHGTSYHSHRGGKQFSLLQDSHYTSTGDLNSFSQPLLDPNSTSGKGCSNQNIFSDQLNRVLNSDCALSLLSSQPAETRDIGFSHMLEPEPRSFVHSLFPTFNYTGLGTDGEPVGSVLISDSRDGANLNCKGMFQIGHDGSSTSRPHHSSWE